MGRSLYKYKIEKVIILKTDRNILIAFLLNIIFSIFEFIGGIFTNSVAILSDSIHDFGDAFSIGISYLMERKSKKSPDNNYTYGYIRYSVLGGVITTTILLVGSILVIIGAVKRLINPVDVNYSGMIILAIIGVLINFIAAFITREDNSINQKAVNLHMLEDVLGWIVVFIGAIIMHFTDIKIIDPIMCIMVSLFILICSLKNLKLVLDLFLEKTPEDIDIDLLKKHLLEINGVDDIHHIHIWSIDGFNVLATMHIVSKSKDISNIKKNVRKELLEYNISHVILENEEDVCDDLECHINLKKSHHH